MMEISEVTCFALKNNGTLLIKTEMDTYDDSYRYCFYISKGLKTIYKSPYETKSFLVYQAQQLGEYKIKAFVRNADGSETVSSTINYTLTEKHAELLAKKEPFPSLSVSVLPVRGKIYALSAKGALLDQALYAWYIYREGESTPVFRGAYSASPAILHEFPGDGTYYAKLFVKKGNEKSTVKSDLIVI